MASGSGRQGASRSQQVRIIGGEWRRRRLRFPDVPDLRPTPDRVRETLFNWLGQDLHDRSCLDLFAGSGALGFEAASRGADPVVMVERDRRAFSALLENAKVLNARQVETIQGDAMAFLERDHRRFDLVFLDPPYRLSLLANLLERLPQHLAPAAEIYLEAAERPQIPPHFNTMRSARAGQVEYLLLQWRPDENPS
ncbi:MAG TPA: 16S rRNA (guanine(966)-N(2))-methyltransferase RsmD [Burkholderiales bacterium]|nr:16S rRNA (guanine(966)-N(2))-methyltransferase RsmD [Burkholderiales bacterium]